MRQLWSGDKTVRVGGRLAAAHPARFVLGRQRPVDYHDVREAGARFGIGDVALNQLGGSWRDLRGGVGDGLHLPEKGNHSSSCRLWDLAPPFENLDEVSGGADWQGRFGQGERFCIGSLGVHKQRQELRWVSALDRAQEFFGSRGAGGVWVSGGVGGCSSAVGEGGTSGGGAAGGEGAGVGGAGGCSWDGLRALFLGGAGLDAVGSSLLRPLRRVPTGIPTARSRRGGVPMSCRARSLRARHKANTASSA
eukprot:scaffold55062_cov47-Phaeocystis_antarctica.AAC.2